MYSYISGEVTQTSENTVVLDVGGIGYELCVSSFTQEKCQVGQRCRLYAYLQVKEDGLSLFGFATEEEKKHVFEAYFHFGHRMQGGAGNFVGHGLQRSCRRHFQR